MPADGYGGAIWQSLPSKGRRKRKREDALWKVFFGRLMIGQREQVRLQVEYGSRTNEAGVKRKSLDRPLLI
jgi:hypothetical protein